MGSKSSKQSFLAAALEGNEGTINKVLSEEREKGTKVSDSVLYSRNEHGWYPIHIAAQSGHTECVRSMLKAASLSRRLDSEPYWGSSPLSPSNHVSLQDLKVSPGGKTAVEIAILHGFPQTALTVLELSEPKSLEPALHYAVRRNQLEVVKFIVEEHNVSADLGPLVSDSVSGTTFQTPIEKAITRGYVPMTQFLLDRGARPKNSTKSAQELLALAAKNEILRSSPLPWHRSQEADRAFVRNAETVESELSRFISDISSQGPTSAERQARVLQVFRGA